MENIFQNRKPVLSGLIAVLTLLLLFLTVSIGVDIVNKIKESKYIGQDVEARNTIVVTETGEVFASPDLAVVSFTVINEAENVEKAMAENASRMNKVIDKMKEKGVEDKDLKTSSFNIYPRYEYEGYDLSYQPGKRILAGYEISQTLEVKIRDMSKIGELIQEAADAGANDVGSLYFTIDNQEELKKQARKQAVEEAKIKASELADQLGVKLGRITSFSENYYTPYYSTKSLDMAEGMGGAEVPNIETGENKISVSVVITYEIY